MYVSVYLYENKQKKPLRNKSYQPLFVSDEIKKSYRSFLLAATTPRKCSYQRRSSKITVY